MIYPEKLVPGQTNSQIAKYFHCCDQNLRKIRSQIEVQFPTQAVLLFEPEGLSESCEAASVGPGTRQGALAPGRAEKNEQAVRNKYFHKMLVHAIVIDDVHSAMRTFSPAMSPWQTTMSNMTPNITKLLQN